MSRTKYDKYRQNKLAILLHEGTPEREAVIQAGFNVRNGIRKYVNNQNVQKKLEVLQKAQSKAALITRDRVLAGHARIAFSTDKKISTSDRQRSLDAISRMCGMDEPKKIEIGRAGEFASLSDNELDEKIKLLHGAVIEATSRVIEESE